MITRRHFGLGLGSVLILGGSLSAANASPLNGLAESSPSEWLDAALVTKQPVGALKLFRFSDSIYALTSAIAWRPAAADKVNRAVEVPPGFVTDFASIPQIFWIALPKDGRYAYAAIIHDYLYWVQDRSREEADDILRLGMLEFRVDPFTVAAIYGSVRLAGHLAWNANAAMKARGQRRVLKRLPKDPLQSWAAWKSEPGVF